MFCIYGLLTLQGRISGYYTFTNLFSSYQKECYSEFFSKKQNERYSRWSTGDRLPKYWKNIEGTLRICQKYDVDMLTICLR